MAYGGVISSNGLIYFLADELEKEVIFTKTVDNVTIFASEPYYLYINDDEDFIFVPYRLDDFIIKDIPLHKFKIVHAYPNTDMSFSYYSYS